MAELEVTRIVTDLATDARTTRANGSKVKTSELRRRLAELGPMLPPPPLTGLPLRPGLPLVALVPSLCRVLASKKAPLWWGSTIGRRRV